MEVLRAARRRWLMVLLVALTFSALAATLGAVRGADYTADSLVRVQDLGKAGSGEVSLEWVQEIRAAAGPEEVSRNAMDGLGWERGIEEFERRLVVEAKDGGRLNVAFSAGNPEMAAEAANVYAETFVRRVEQLDGSRLAGGNLNAGAEVVREAEPPSLPTISRPLMVGLAAFIPGLVAGGVLALTLRGRDSTLRLREDVGEAEIALGAPVLGVIPELGAGEPESGDGDVVHEP